jgi:hypothetical protein
MEWRAVVCIKHMGITMRRSSTLSIAMDWRHSGTHPVLCVPFDLLPSMARPGLFGGD